MPKGLDIVAEFPGILVIHQKLPGREVGRHKHAEHEFFLPLQGEITVRYGNETNETVKAGPGRMLYVPPRLDHSFFASAQGSGERVIWLINEKAWSRQITSVYLPASLPINSLAKELVFYLLIHRHAPGAKYFISALVETLGDALDAARLENRRVFSEHILGKIEDTRVIRSIEFINKVPQSVNLAEVARQSGLSQRNFNRLFLKETGLSPKEYLILRRVEKAKRLLRETKMTVTDISLEVGYNSLSKFIATFKRITGVLPSDYRFENKYDG